MIFHVFIDRIWNPRCSAFLFETLMESMEVEVIVGSRTLLQEECPSRLPLESGWLPIVSLSFFISLLGKHCPHLNNKLVERRGENYCLGQTLSICPLLNWRKNFYYHTRPRRVRYGVAFQLIARMKAQGAKRQRRLILTQTEKKGICVASLLKMTLLFKLVKIYVHWFTHEKFDLLGRLRM